MSKSTMKPAYRIATVQTIIRCWQPADAPLLKEAIDVSIEHLRPWMPWAHFEPTGLQAKIDLTRRFRSQFDRDEEYVYGIFDRDETMVLGGSGLHTRVGDNALEIGYWIRAGQTGRGLATETTAALTLVAFVLHNVDRVEIHCDPLNLSSAAIPRKLGFTHEATLRRRVTTDEPGALRDSMIWTLFRDDYAHTPVASAEIQAFDAIGREIPIFK